MEDECWMVWGRNDSNSPWEAMVHTGSAVKDMSIREVDVFMGRGHFESMRRRGLVKCVRTRLVGEGAHTEERE